jgi:hypothetical protein
MRSADSTSASESEMEQRKGTRAFGNGPKPLGCALDTLFLRFDQPPGRYCVVEETSITALRLCLMLCKCPVGVKVLIPRAVLMTCCFAGWKTTVLLLK